MASREYDVVTEGRLDAAPVLEQFNKTAPDQVVEPEVKAPQPKEARAPEVPKLELNPPTPMGRGPEVQLPGQQQATRSLAERKQAAQERGEEREQGQASKQLSEEFTRAKFRSLAERRFNAAAKGQDVGQER